MVKVGESNSEYKSKSLGPIRAVWCTAGDVYCSAGMAERRRPSLKEGCEGYRALNARNGYLSKKNTQLPTRLLSLG